MSEVRAPDDLDQLRQRYSKFVRTAAHALRTPLQSLQGFAELLEPRVSRARADYYLGFIRHDAAILTGVVDDLCLWDELEHGPLALFPVEIEVGPLLTELAQTFEASFQDCVVVLEYQDDFPRIYADVERLQHILRTLLRNVECRRTDRVQTSYVLVSAGLNAEGGQMKFSVLDDCPTIPLAMAAAIFDIVPRRPTGLDGLGLHVARAAARKMGGDLWLEPPAGASADAEIGQRGNQLVLSLPIYDGLPKDG